MFGWLGGKKGVPRWGFASGWDDYLAAVRCELALRRVPFEDRDLQAGTVPLPEPAAYEGWDLRAITARCRELVARLAG